MQVPVGSSGTCAVTSTIVVPDGYYGVFRADSRVHSELDTGDSATYSLTSNSQTGNALVHGPSSDDLEFTHYYATGLASGPTAFTGDATIDASGVDPSFYGEYDSVDLLLAYTTKQQQQDSIDLIGLQQLAISTHLDETATLLTGGDLPLEGANEFRVLGAVGSGTLGVTGRYNLADGFSLLGGASIVDFGVPGGNASGVLAAGAARFVQPGSDEFRLMGEAGVQAAGLGLSFSRHYEDGSTVGTDATGSGFGVLASVYAKGGVLWAPDAYDAVLFAGTVKQGALGIGSFSEADSNANPNLFAADFSNTAQNFTTVKVGADWTRKLTSNLDLTASLAAGAATGSGATAEVFGIGTVNGHAQSTFFAEYGLRVGWDVAQGARADGFIAGSTGTNIGTHAQIGAGYSFSF
jgi:hypothetical protein